MEDRVNIQVIWQDAHIIVLNKPAGLLSLPDGYNPNTAHIKAVLSADVGPLWIVHRLDRFTSGVIVLARSAQSHRHLNTQFQEHRVKKIYHALVVGNPEWDQKIIDLPLRVDGDRKHRTVVDIRSGKRSITRLKILDRYKNYSLVEAIPESGRRHQIRAHLAAKGLPIVCDALYGNGSEIKLSRVDFPKGEEISATIKLLSRIGLHARSIMFLHPYTQEELFLEAQYPDDFILTVEILRSQRGP
jgi:tRNA pseudouridine32 synthase/23S rRNA pseudouridine746 synthase